MPPLSPHVSLTDEQFAAFRAPRYGIAVDDAVFRVDGLGAIDCLQGLLTNDVAKAGAGGAVWGAFLTPKGMIITDAWVLRAEGSAWVLVPGTMRETLQQLFARTIPPRLARVADHSNDTWVRWLCGGVPAAAPDAELYTPHALAPFTALALTSDAAQTDARLAQHGWNAAPGRFADVAKLLLGWPSLGREIDERTLTQEVRFDELGGVRYDKGCYTGQETVARTHFRGHTNRVLRGICWAPGDRPTDTQVSDGDKVVGTLRTVGQLGDRWLALAMLRREVALGDTVRAGASEGVVIEPPFDLGESAVA
ncbi:MAG: YgfZ/GcvT domain-containing protein [Gemmatimonadales bacterium]